MKPMNGINENQATNLKNKEEDEVEISGLTTQLGHIMFFFWKLSCERTCTLCFAENRHFIGCMMLRKDIKRTPQ